MTKITIKATLEELDRLDYIGLFDVEAAGVLYEQIEVTSWDEEKAKEGDAE